MNRTSAALSVSLLCTASAGYAQIDDTPDNEKEIAPHRKGEQPYIPMDTSDPTWNLWKQIRKDLSEGRDPGPINVQRYEGHVSVTGEQLTDIYLEHRRALDLENRGGARARVDRVEVTQVDSVVNEADGGLTVTARWNVSGSVNHFGHTHYRRNRYAALVRLLPVDGVWKITQIDVRDEEREL